MWILVHEQVTNEGWHPGSEFTVVPVETVDGAVDRAARILADYEPELVPRYRDAVAPHLLDTGVWLCTYPRKGNGHYLQAFDVAPDSMEFQICHDEAVTVEYAG